MTQSPSDFRQRAAAFTLVELGVILLIIVILFALLLPWVQKVSDKDSARVESKNNLKQLGLAINMFGEIPHNKLPPAYGIYHDKTGSVFVHILPHIEGFEEEHNWRRKPITRFIKTYFASLDPTNPGIEPALTSYASNATLFTGNTRFPECFGVKGSSNTILFVERYARTGADTKHPWAGENTSLDIGLMNIASCWVEFDTPPAEAIDLAAHAFTQAGCLAALGDGTVKDMSREINTNVGRFDQNGVKTFMVFNWAGDPLGATAAIPAPPLW